MKNNFNKLCEPRNVSINNVDFYKLLHCVHYDILKEINGILKRLNKPKAYLNSVEVLDCITEVFFKYVNNLEVEEVE